MPYCSGCNRLVVRGITGDKRVVMLDPKEHAYRVVGGIPVADDEVLIERSTSSLVPHRLTCPAPKTYDERNRTGEQNEI